MSLNPNTYLIEECSSFLVCARLNVHTLKYQLRCTTAYPHEEAINCEPARQSPAPNMATTTIAICGRCESHIERVVVQVLYMYALTFGKLNYINRPCNCHFVAEDQGPTPLVSTRYDVSRQLRALPANT